MAHRKRSKGRNRTRSVEPPFPARRAWIKNVITAGVGYVVGRAGEGIIGDRAVKFFDRLLPDAPLIRPGKSSNDPGDWLRQLFGEWTYYEAAPGKDHRDYNQQRIIHPDILAPFRSMLRLWDRQGHQLIPTKEEQLPEINPEESLVLIGGPVSNVYARQWQGYSQSPSTGIFQFTDPSVRRRWRFEYDLNESKDQGPTRFIDGKLHRAWPQAIADQQEGCLIRPKVQGADRLLAEDWLLLSFVPNVFAPGRGSTIVDASDLHGQGNKAFGQLVNDIDRLHELVLLIKSRNIRPGEYFQALYRVDVAHDDMQTSIRDYVLVAVAPVKSK
jgi:hypothetical protein